MSFRLRLHSGLRQRGAVLRTVRLFAGLKPGAYTTLLRKVEGCHLSNVCGSQFLFKVRETGRPFGPRQSKVGSPSAACRETSRFAFGPTPACGSKAWPLRTVRLFAGLKPGAP